MSALHKSLQAVLLPALVVAVLCGLAAFAATWRYAGQGEALLERLDRSVGEVLMTQGMALEKAGQWSAATAQYEAALEARFHGPQNRAFTQKSLATVYWKLGRKEEAARNFEAVHDTPYWALVWYEPYTDVLAGADKLAVAEAWQQEAAAAGRPDQEARACFALGQAHATLGQMEQAREAFAAGAALAPGSLNDCALAAWLAEEGATEEALDRLTACLAQGVTGHAGEEARRLRHTLLQEAGTSP